MKYMAAVLLLVVAMSAQKVPSTNKREKNTGIEGLRGLLRAPYKGPASPAT